MCKVIKRWFGKDGGKGSKVRRGVKRHETKCQERKHGGWVGGGERDYCPGVSLSNQGSVKGCLLFMLIVISVYRVMR